MHSIIEKYDLFIKDQISHQARAASHYAEKQDDLRSSAYADRAKKMQEMWSDVSGALESVSVLPEAVEAQFHLSPSEIEGLPAELIKELGINESDRKEFLLIELIGGMGGIASINKLLVAIYHETSEVEKRTRLVARLYRMQQKGMVHTTPERKGVYSLKPIPEGYFGTEEAELAGKEDGDESET